MRRPARPTERAKVRPITQRSSVLLRWSDLGAHGLIGSDQGQNPSMAGSRDQSDLVSLFFACPELFQVAVAHST